jgi:hypothetical protein
VVLCEVLQVGYCAAEVNGCVLHYKMALCEAVQVEHCAAELKGCMWRYTGSSV